MAGDIVHWAKGIRLTCAAARRAKSPV